MLNMQNSSGNGNLGVPFPLSKSGSIPGSIFMRMKANWRKPWSLFPTDYYKQFNYSYTINPDPKCKWIIDNDCRDRQTHHAKLREFLINAYYQKLFSAVVVIYEYGKHGKKFGKLHFHCLFRTNKAEKLRLCALSYFAANKNNNRAVVKKRITHSLKKSNQGSTLLMMKQSLLENKQYIYKTYFRKEQPCRLKCLVHI